MKITGIADSIQAKCDQIAECLLKKVPIDIAGLLENIISWNESVKSLEVSEPCFFCETPIKINEQHSGYASLSINNLVVPRGEEIAHLRTKNKKLIICVDCLQNDDKAQQIVGRFT